VVVQELLGAEITPRLLPTHRKLRAHGASFSSHFSWCPQPVRPVDDHGFPQLFAILSGSRDGLTAFRSRSATILIGPHLLGATEKTEFLFLSFSGRRSAGTTAGARGTPHVGAGRPDFCLPRRFILQRLSRSPHCRTSADARVRHVASSAFVLARLADFTSLPVALWILSRDYIGHRRRLSAA